MAKRGIPSEDPLAPLTQHASAVALAGAGVLILGGSGQGKSRLALDLMSRGADLVADDRCRLARRNGRLLAWAPPTLLGMIEARGVGLLRATPAPPSGLVLAVDLDRAETERLPPARHRRFLGLDLPLIHGAGHPFLAAAVLQILKEGWAEV